MNYGKIIYEEIATCHFFEHVDVLVYVPLRLRKGDRQEGRARKTEVGTPRMERRELRWKRKTC